MHSIYSQCGDIVDPTASNPSSLMVECIFDVPAPDPLVVINEADNSGVLPIVAFVNDVSDGNTCPEQITRTYSITDTCGNTINVTQNISVNDNTAPTGSNPDTIFVAHTVDVPWANTVAVIDELDNCTVNPVVTFVSDVSDGLTCPETITRTYGIADECGNFINVIQKIRIGANPNFTAFADSLTADMQNQNYQWLDCDNGFAPILGATDQTFVPLVSGNYVVEVTTLAGCKDTSTCYYFEFADIIDNNQSEIIFYPNPATDFLYFQIDNHESVLIQMINLDGKIVLEQTSSDPLTKLNVEVLNSGTYIVKITGSDFIQCEMVIKY